MVVRVELESQHGDESVYKLPGARCPGLNSWMLSVSLFRFDALLSFCLSFPMLHTPYTRYYHDPLDMRIVLYAGFWLS
jgi:hypothetical protein